QPGDEGLNGYRLDLLHDYLRKHAGGGSRNLGVDLIGRDLEDRLIALHLVAHFLQPPRKCAFGDGLAHLRHEDVYTCHCCSAFMCSAGVDSVCSMQSTAA